jgi:predicted negative regulator of RcsB-dependent stress response
MSSALSSSGSTSVAAVVSGFAERHRVVLLVVAGTLLAALIIWLAWAERERSVEESSALRAERLQELYVTWRAEPEGTRKSNLGEDLLEDVEHILRRFPRRYAAQRAFYVRAQYRFELEQWNDAAADWQEVAARWPDSYLAPLSIFNAAVAVEEAGQAEAALEHLQRIVDQWEASLVVPRALFSIGRMAEQRTDYGTAEASYDRLTEEYGGSRWSTAARNRLIALETQSRLAAE